MARLQIKRVYDPPAPGDGTRVLVDRLWPRGLTKEKAAVDLWLKAVSPSDALRKRVHADPADWEAFVADYAAELEREPTRTAAEELLALARQGPVMLLFAAKDVTRNNATVLRIWLEAKMA